VLEETQSRCFGWGNAKCEDSIVIELVVKCDPGYLLTPWSRVLLEKLTGL
jgi:hypothetical protein